MGKKKLMALIHLKWIEYEWVSPNPQRIPLWMKAISLCFKSPCKKFSIIVYQRTQMCTHQRAHNPNGEIWHMSSQTEAFHCYDSAIWLFRYSKSPCLSVPAFWNRHRQIVAPPFFFFLAFVEILYVFITRRYNLNSSRLTQPSIFVRWVKDCGGNMQIILTLYISQRMLWSIMGWYTV